MTEILKCTYEGKVNDKLNWWWYQKPLSNLSNPKTEEHHVTKQLESIKYIRYQDIQNISRWQKLIQIIN